ncbi:alpha/beta hydrolase [Conexibacter sp. CPCC 206217]|uniref:alpha/beta hydrolase n=1 Tax=Conexibacter sp. CPCC 206217 TaxID=3064574 RepID=UPI002720BDC9|nr:alpha/beta fold hydrolase [Conexibacter sp. CPCC 206217]MDO8208866.1 alpha/beta fold hydrolase [Conexibacter sp. CPCC 206217]
MTGQAAAVERLDVAFPSGDASCSAWLHRPVGDRLAPVVVLGHGLGATREMRLDAYARRFAAHGLAALAFTYRHFGDSEGTPRQLLSVARQLEDWESAIAHVRTRKDVDGRRVAIWGSSFGGGHAITIAARHPELAAAVAQCPFTDGLASARALGLATSVKAIPLLLRDTLAAIAGRPPVTIPVAAPPGDVALMNAPDAASGYHALIPDGLPFRNEVAARIIPSLSAYRPGRAAKDVRIPILFCVSDTDTVAPPGPTLRYARTAPHGDVRRYDAGHFAFYVGETFEQIVADQVEFLTSRLL